MYRYIVFTYWMTFWSICGTFSCDFNNLLPIIAQYYVFVYTIANANPVGAEGMRGPVHPGGIGHAWSPLKDSGSTMAEPSYYELLGLKPGASPDSIKNTYRILAKKHHLDKNCGPDATRIFQNLNKPYQALINHDTLDTTQCKCDSDCQIAAA